MKLDESLYSTVFCAIDLETTGISPFRDKIIEIGVVKFKVEDGVIEKYSTLINPTIPVTENAYNVHGIADHMLVKAPLFKDISADFLNFIKGSVLVIQNPKFDLSFIEMECMKAGIEFPNTFSFDTVTLSRKVIKDVKNHKLQTLCEYLDLNLNFHRALDDAIGCMEVFRFIINKIDENKKMSLSNLLKFQGSVDKSGIIAEIDSNNVRGRRIQSGDKVKIEYRDSSGNITERIIKVYKIYRRGNHNVIYGYCYLRNDIRYFKTSRIKKIQKQ